MEVVCILIWSPKLHIFDFKPAKRFRTVSESSEWESYNVNTPNKKLTQKVEVEVNDTIMNWWLSGDYFLWFQMVDVFVSLFLSPPEELEESQSSNREQTCVFVCLCLFMQYFVYLLMNLINIQTK